MLSDGWGFNTPEIIDCNLVKEEGDGKWDQVRVGKYRSQDILRGKGHGGAREGEKGEWKGRRDVGYMF